MNVSVAILASLMGLACLANVRPQDDVMRRTGGLVAREGRGRLLIVNLQDAIPAETVKAKAAYVSSLLGIRVEVRSDATESGTVTIVLPGEAGPRPSSGKWRGVVDPTSASSGFDAAFARVAADLFVPEGRNTRCSRADVEALFRGDSFTLAARDEILKFLPEIGFSPAAVATYLTACSEGWAPAPTNDVQKAIWEKVHAIPKQPIKIDFDPKKGK